MLEELRYSLPICAVLAVEPGSASALFWPLPLGLYPWVTLPTAQQQVASPNISSACPVVFSQGVSARWWWRCLRCLPHLILLGGFHSGAGGLAHALSQHPDVITTSSSNNQFWAEVRGAAGCLKEVDGD